MSRISLASLTSAALLMSLSALAGPGSSGGGDEVGLDFQASAAQGVASLPVSALRSEDWQKLREMLDQAKYVVVDTSLPVDIGLGESQDSAATNDPSQRTVTIQRQRWLKLKSSFVKSRLALHEVLSLARIEKTGDYHVSATLKAEVDSKALPEASLLYSRYYDQGLTGLSEESALDQCSYQKSVYAEDYKLVYCSYIEKRIPRGYHRFESAYGLAVFGIAKPAQTQWQTVFSSLKFLDGQFGSLVYPDADQAMEACSLKLAESALRQPSWFGARCFIEKDSSGYFYEIRKPL
ncbi:MAG: hypothetical protein ACJ763_14170 [Bdellovibrionia bacterium]